LLGVFGEQRGGVDAGAYAFDVASVPVEQFNTAEGAVAG
jgi:hypothetical protein